VDYILERLNMNAPKTMLRCVPADFPVRRTRHLRFIELWEPRNWVLKIYFHSAHPEQLSREFLAKAKIFIEPQLMEAEQTEPLHRVGVPEADAVNERPRVHHAARRRAGKRS
jgi:hypothetical protein